MVPPPDAAAADAAFRFRSAWRFFFLSAAEKASLSASLKDAGGVKDPTSSSSEVGDATSISVMSMLSKAPLRLELEAPDPNGAIPDGVLKASPPRGRLDPGAASLGCELRSCEIWCISCRALVGREPAGGGGATPEEVSEDLVWDECAWAADGSTSGGSGGMWWCRRRPPFWVEAPGGW